MRKQIVAGNWKMNNDLSETETLLNDLKKQVIPENVSVLVAPTFTNLYAAFNSVIDHPIEVVAQNMHQAKNGAYTGEVSAQMLQSVGVKTVILGHSERRAYFHETNALLAEKVTAALENEMTAIFCFGEELEDRKSGNHFELVASQLKEGLFHIAEADWKQIVLAYEPVWAIGTGETASPEQAQEMHAFVRKTIAEAYSESVATNVSILYGGSVKPANASEIFGKPDVDGGLIGGAALNAESFMGIVNAFETK
ncbi:triose-phosphate isomerase [Ulvibacter litoralis]|uniref:Triosephosphate isomerase n=1 Tax=Ulvibacter litoralis TaxID=227084 RepID=A0A1G7GM78_9FLAO|nr:triose-phosphate isomerase [Ulvibacter litoralis]GHC55681.1 triosephosphate isomerase [Ulvibacter litoralis]SDE89247.1 triosephosphate isomerase (TIM) [Ulvibacter litoralis]